jgi:hypothetical protein
MDLIGEVYMKKTLLFILVFELLIFNFSFSNTHYVSKTGSDTYPYTSWETAADSIKKAIDAADFWDTVRVGSGTYKESIILKKGLSLIGAGWDSTYIEGDPSKDYVVSMGDSSLIEGFCLTEFTESYPVIACFDAVYTKIQKNKFIPKLAENGGVFLMGSSAIIEDNIFDKRSPGIEATWYSWALIRNNYFSESDIAGDFSSFKILNNIFDTKASIWAVDIDYGDSVVIKNNVIFNFKRGFLFVFNLGPSIGPPDTVMNNVVVGEINPENYGMIVPSGASCTNNIVTGFEWGLLAPADAIVNYNDAWGNKVNYTVEPDTGNISADPMFVNPDSDFHLQKYSPCIDAGDPNIKDPDSSRSDIGAYGGPLGQSYTYLDYPPKAPDSLNASFDSSAITLNWKPNTEADLSHYTIYKDTLFGFIPDSSKIVGSISKDSSSFDDHNWVYGTTYYYKLSAWDLTNHQSPYSDELMIKATDVPWTDEIKVEIDKYSLSQNYPNPFNPVTTICYYIPDIGAKPAKVEIIVYNLLGAKIRTLVSEYKYPGEYRVVWDGRDDSRKDVSSGIYFYRMTIWGSEFSKAKKMMLLR